MESSGKSSVPKHGGKFGKLKRPSRARKRKFHGNQNAAKLNKNINLVEVEEQQQQTTTTHEVDDAELVLIPSLPDDVSVNVEADAPTAPTDIPTATDVPTAPTDVPTAPPVHTPVSASSKKIRTVNLPNTEGTAPPCNIIIDTELFLNLWKKVVTKCPECGCTVEVTHEPKLKCGLAHFFMAECHCKCTKLCEWKHIQPTSKTITREKQRGKKSHEINLRSILAFREIGRGYRSIQEFCRHMNMPPPMDRKCYRKSFTRLYRAYSKIAQDSLSRAAEQVDCSPGDDGITNVTASFDGTWQRRGYSSLNGVITSISNGKVVDYEVMSKVCPQCKYWGKRKKGKDFEEWKLEHDCLINHSGSAGSMEVNGVTRIFKRSVDTKKLRYTTYLGDGDSKGYEMVSSSNIYPGYPIGKAECIGHVQKRVGGRLRTMKQNWKGKLLSDGKRLTGAGRLTEKVMNTLQNYYGMVIRSNVGNLYQMKKGIAAILFHCSEHLDINNEPDHAERHKYCPQGKDSWCKYQSDQVTGLSNYKAKINIPTAVRDLIKPVFSYQDLASDDLLKKCLHGETQNVNESFNNCIWRKAPKDTFVARRTLEVATASAALHFNDGSSGILKVMEDCDFEPGHYAIVGAAAMNKARVKAMNRKSTDKCKNIRKRARAIRKGYQDKESEEVPTYIPGGF